MLRLEIRLGFWLAAGLSIAGAVLRGLNAENPVPADSIDLTQPAPAAVSIRAAVIAPSALPEIDRQVRPLFDVAPPAAASLPPPAPIVAAVPPVLKGIIESDGTPRAIFALDPSAPAYTSVGIGDPLGSYRISAISRDRVVAVGSDGASSSFLLRGTGEAP